MSSTIDIVLETKLTEDDWFPQGAYSHEHDFKQESIKERVKKVNQWFDGEIPSSDLLP